MKRFVSWILCFCLVALTLSGCSASNEELLVGRWTVKADLGQAYETMLAEADPSVTGHIDIGEFKVDMFLEFHENGSFSWTLDQDQLAAGVKNMMDAIAQGLTVYLQIETGMKIEDLLRATGYDMDQMMTRFFDPDMAKVVTENLGAKGTYSFKDGKLVLVNDQKFVIYEGNFTVTETTLKLTGGHCEELLGTLLPLTFKK